MPETIGEPLYDPEVLLDGDPYPPYRATVPRLAISTTLVTPETKINAYPLPVQPGDTFTTVSFVTSTEGGTLSHSWVAIYDGVGTGAALLAQTTDDTTSTGWATGAQNLALDEVIRATDAAVWGVVVYQAGTTGNTLDAAGGSSEADTALASQVPLYSDGTLAATGTAPSVLPTMTPAVGKVPYLVLSEQTS